MSNKRPLTNQLSVLACVLSAAIFTGCATKNYDRGAKTANVMNSAASQCAALSHQLTASLDALRTLEYQSQGDLRTHYVSFADTVTSLKAGGRQLNKKITSAQSRASAYLKDWGQHSSAIQSQQIRSISKQQRQGISEKLLAVNKEYQEMKSAFKPFMTDVAGIKTYLGSDLTVNGLHAIKQVVGKTKTDAIPLRQSLQALQSDLSSLGSAVSPDVSGGGQS